MSTLESLMKKRQGMRTYRIRKWDAEGTGPEGSWTTVEGSGTECVFCHQANHSSWQEPGVLFLEIEGEEDLRRVEKLNEGWPALVVCFSVTRESARKEFEAWKKDEEGGST